MAKGKIDSDPGITALWGITPNLILNGTVNPDFSQIEADVAQMDVNIRFALRYPEKRPFFLEGADFFLTPLEAVFTRTVADPQWGLKLTGKSGRNAFGVFAARDRVNNLIFPSNQGSMSASLDEKVMGGVIRYRRDIGRGSTLGLLFTNRRTNNDYGNSVFGADGFFRLSRTNTINFQYLHSETNYRDAIAPLYGQEEERFGGNAVYAEFFHISRNWIVFSNYRDISPGFRADYGFIPRVDLRNFVALARRRFWGKPGSWFTQLAVGVVADRTVDHNWNLTDQILGLYAGYNGPLQSAVEMYIFQNKEYFNNVMYDLTVLQFTSEMKPTGGLSFTLVGMYGDGIDYSNSRSATLLNLIPGLELSLGKHININFSHTLQRLTIKEGEIFEANLFQTRLIYHFNIRTFFRAIIQFTDVARNPSLYVYPVQPKSQMVFTQLLFSYKINPQTVLFLGYSDNYLGITGIDITRTDRTFFIKVGYAWTM
jgi:hypothetical protein